ncbi:hypothetical protein N9S30_00240 [bacterium]|nr:hypothetical protein [bacterium]
MSIVEMSTPNIADESHHTMITGASISEPSSGDDIGSGDTDSGSGVGTDDDDDDSLTNGQLAAIIISSIIGATLIALVAYFLINMYCPMASAANPSFSPVVSLASQPIVITAS